MHSATAGGKAPHWVAYEKNARWQLGQVATTSAKTICLHSGEKIPLRRVWLANAPPPSAALAQQIAAAAAQLPVDKLWQLAAGKTLTLAELASAAGSSAASWQLAVLQQVLAHPVYFRRHDHHITATDAATVQKALASLQQRQQQQQQQDEMAQQLAAGELPAAIKNEALALLFAADKTAASYRVLKKHLGADGIAFARFFIAHGLLADELAYFEHSFRRQWLPPPPAEICATQPPPPLPAAALPATFSIDDNGTKEIDDAFSIQPQGGTRWLIGIHIAAPALLLSAAGDAAARRRLTSVYFPHAKHFMLPAAAVAACSLTVGEERPALSLYVEIDTAAASWRLCESKVETLRLSTTATPEQVDSGDIPAPLAEAIAALHRATAVLAPQMAVTTAGSSYKIDAAQLTIRARPRTGAAQMVEILMRTANSLWSKQIIASGGGGLYRDEGGLKLQPPAAPYMWLTSPLRRYVDLANQRLLLASLQQQPPAKENWHQLRRDFERQYALARRFQQLMDTHWALRILAAAPAARLAGSYLGKRRVRLADYPLTGLLQQPPAAGKKNLHVRVQAIDLLHQQLALALAEGDP